MTLFAFILGFYIGIIAGGVIAMLARRDVPLTK